MRGVRSRAAPEPELEGSAGQVQDRVLIGEEYRNWKLGCEWPLPARLCAFSAPGTGPFQLPAA